MTYKEKPIEVEISNEDHKKELRSSELENIIWEIFASDEAKSAYKKRIRNEKLNELLK